MMKQGNVQKLFIILMLFCYTCTNILINALVSTQIAKDAGFSVSLPTLTMLIGGGRLKKLGGTEHCYFRGPSSSSGFGGILCQENF